MKKNKQFANGEITVIGAGTVIEGLLKTNASTRIDGTVNGDVTSEGVVVVASEGVVNGNIEAMDVKISGTVNGNVSTSGKTELISNGKLFGDVQTGSFSVDENAIFQGSCKMKDAEDGKENVTTNNGAPETKKNKKHK